MGDISISDLNIQFLDVLQEIGNIGAGNATTALAKMINKKVDMDVPKVKVLDFKDVGDTLGGAEKEVVGLLFGVEGDITGLMMYVLSVDSARALLSVLMGEEIEKDKEFSEMEESALKEIGNILAGSYLSSLATLMKLKIKIMPPEVATDMAGAILSVPAIEFGKIDDRVLFIESGITDGEKSVEGYFILVSDINSFKVILESLGVM